MSAEKKKNFKVIMKTAKEQQLFSKVNTVQCIWHAEYTGLLCFLDVLSQQLS